MEMKSLTKSGEMREESHSPGFPKKSAEKTNLSTGQSGEPPTPDLPRGIYSSNRLHSIGRRVGRIDEPNINMGEVASAQTKTE